jgi:hypothetical protein
VSIFLTLGYLIGMFVAGAVFRGRSGISFWAILGLDFAFSNPSWFILTCAKMFVWPAVLGFWLFQGKPASPWRVGERGKIRRVRAAA